MATQRVRSIPIFNVTDTEPVAEGSSKSIPSHLIASLAVYRPHGYTFAEIV